MENLYNNQTVVIKLEGYQSDGIDIKRVRHGSFLSPLFCNVYPEAILKEAFCEETSGVMVNGISIHNDRCADEIVLITDNIQDLKRIVEKVETTSKRYNLKMNLWKIKFMNFTKSQNNNNQ